jgi:G:T-mismatch repair DNA endonuclease (very short patch repair protein)
LICYEKKSRSATMSKIRSRDTIPEIMLRKELFAQGIRSQHLKGWRSKQGSIMTESWNLQRIAVKLISAESMPMAT